MGKFLDKFLLRKAKELQKKVEDADHILADTMSEITRLRFSPRAVLLQEELEKLIVCYGNNRYEQGVSRASGFMVHCCCSSTCDCDKAKKTGKEIKELIDDLVEMAKREKPWIL